MVSLAAVQMILSEYFVNPPGRTKALSLRFQNKKSEGSFSTEPFYPLTMRLAIGKELVLLHGMLI